MSVTVQVVGTGLRMRGLTKEDAIGWLTGYLSSSPPVEDLRITLDFGKEVAPKQPREEVPKRPREEPRRPEPSLPGWDAFSKLFDNREPLRIIQDVLGVAYDVVSEAVKDAKNVEEVKNDRSSTH